MLARRFLQGKGLAAAALAAAMVGAKVAPGRTKTLAAAPQIERQAHGPL